MKKIHPNYNRVLITGATGYIGSQLAISLVAAGINVHVVTRPGAKLKPLQSIQDEITIHEHDGTTENLIDIVENAKPDIVFHLASLFLSNHSPSEIGNLITSNVLFGTQLFEAMALNKVHKLVNTGTSWQHFQNKDYCPVNLYAATKQALECILEYYVDAHAFCVSTLLLFDTFGPQDPRNKIFSLFMRATRTNERLLLSPGEQFIDLVYIADVIEAFEAAACAVIDRKGGHMRYGISSGKPIKLRDFASKFEEIVGIKLDIHWGAREYRKREVMIPWNMGQTLSNWAPKTSLEKGIKESYSGKSEKKAPTDQ